MWTDTRLELLETTYPVSLVMPVVAFDRPEEGQPVPETQAADDQPELAGEGLESLTQPEPAETTVFCAEDPARAALSNYWDLVRAKISKNARYPYTAARQGVEGMVNIRLKLAADGRLEECLILDASSPSLQQAALNAVHRAAPFSPAPDSMDIPRCAVLPIHFTLNTNPPREDAE